MKINFNNVRRNACRAHDRLVRLLNASIDDGPVSVEVKKRVKIANRIVGWVIIVLVAVGTSAAMVKILRILGLIS